MMEILQMRCLHVEVQEACQATAAVGNVQRQRAARQNAAQGKIPRSEYGTSQVQRLQARQRADHVCVPVAHGQVPHRQRAELAAVDGDQC